MGKEHDIDYRILRYVNDRNHLYTTSLVCLKAELYDVPEDQFDPVFNDLLNERKYIEYKPDNEQGLGMTNRGNTAINDFAKQIQRENRKAKPWRERNWLLIALVFGVISYAAGVFQPWLSEMVKSEFREDSMTQSVSPKIDTVSSPKNDQSGRNNSTESDSSLRK